MLGCFSRGPIANLGWRWLPPVPTKVGIYQS